MDTFERFYRRGSGFKFDTILESAPITEAQKYHITKVYNTLAYTALVTYLTVALNGPWKHVNPVIAGVLMIFAIMYILFTKFNKEELNVSRLVALTVFPACLGIIHRNFILDTFKLNPDIVNTALMGSVAIFGTFSVAALFITERVRLFVTSVVASLSLYIALATFMNLFVKSELSNSVLVSLGIVLFVGYIVVDTQRILHDFNRGDDDYIIHAILLYYDLFELFFRILIMLKEKEEKKNQQNKNKDD